MNKIGIIIPYFGNFPNYFELWLACCEKNKEIDFLIFTDNVNTYNYPGNVHVSIISFREIKERIQSLYDFSISLDNTYKLCDFRPAYGEIFEKELLKYEYWGYCDVDLIFGNIRKFITDDILEQYDKIFQRGHLSLMKNKFEITRLYRKTLGGEEVYKKVFSTKENCTFDEKFLEGWGGINGIFHEQNKNIYINDLIVADINIKHKNFYVNSDNCFNKKIFLYNFKNNGSLYKCEYNEENILKEYIYIHLQKRTMAFQISEKWNEKYLIVPNKFIEVPNNFNMKQIIEKYNKNGAVYFPYIKIRLNNLIKKIKRIWR